MAHRRRVQRQSTIHHKQRVWFFHDTFCHRDAIQVLLQHTLQLRILCLQPVTLVSDCQLVKKGLHHKHSVV